MLAEQYLLQITGHMSHRKTVKKPLYFSIQKASNKATTIASKTSLWTQGL